MPILLCFGDSNTHGSIPMLHRDDSRRFGPDERWPGVLRRELGAGWTVIEEGLPGRTTLHDDPIEGHAEVVGDDLREGRLVPLAVRRGAGIRGH